MLNRTQNRLNLRKADNDHFVAVYIHPGGEMYFKFEKTCYRDLDQVNKITRAAYICAPIHTYAERYRRF